MSSLPEPLRTFATRAFATKITNDDDDDNYYLDELELSIRGHLLDLVHRLLSSSSSTSHSAAAASSMAERSIMDELLFFIKNVTMLCIKGIKVVVSSSSQSSAIDATTAKEVGVRSIIPPSYLMSIKKLPFVLLEDAIDTLPIQHMYTLWSEGASMSSSTAASASLHHVSSYAVTQLCSSILFDNQTTKLSLLKVCNKMLKKIGTHRSSGSSSSAGSATNNNNNNNNVDGDIGYAKFAGEIMILLSTVFPLGERSAINVLGTFNIGNITNYDDDDNGNDEAKTTTVGGGQDVVTKTTEGMKRPSQLDNNCIVDDIHSYEIYQKFWKLQRVFSNPHGTILPSRGGGGPNVTTAGEAYDTFFKDVMSILTVLEGIPVLLEISATSTPTTGGSDSDMVDDSNNSSSANATTTTTTTTVLQHHHKYLTSRSLLPLQLRDSQLRIHFLTQLLIALSHLSSPNVTLPGTSVAEIRRRRQLTLTEDRAMQLLRSMKLPPPLQSGERVAQCVKWILTDRETMWRTWKRAKCMPALDKVGSDTTMMAKTDGYVIREALLLRGRTNKRKTYAAHVVVSTDNCTAMMDTSDDDAAACGDDDDNEITITNLSKHTSRITDSLHTLDTLLDPYVEALDPENGIEGEYHPRNDKVYCWRALRMLARDQSEFGGQLQRFNMLRMRDGDFEGVVRDMWMKESRGDIGGSILDVEYYAEKNTKERHNSIGGEDDKVAADGGGGGTDDMMDDVSVGTTEEATQARLEKEADFKKAAMEAARMMEEEMLIEENDDEVTQDDAQTRPGKNIKVLRNVVEATSEDAMGNVHDDEEEKLLSVLENIPEVEGTTKESSSPGDDINHNGNSFTPSAARFKSKTWTRNDDKTTSTTGAKVADPAFNNKWTRNGGDTPASKEVSRKTSDSSFNGKMDEEQNVVESKSSSPSRAKFVPAQKVQEERQKKFEPRNTSAGRNDGKKRNQGDDNDSSLDFPQQSKHAKWEGRSAHHRGGSVDSGKNRDSNSRSPALNNTNNPPSGNGNDEGTVGPPSQQRGGWEPPRGRGGGREGSQGRGTGRGRGYQNNRGKQDRSNDSNGGRDRR
jgi:THO complex subunit 1